MSPQTTLIATYRTSLLVYSGKAGLPLKEYTTYLATLQSLSQEEILRLGQHRIMLGGGLHLDLLLYRFSPGIKLGIPLQ
jgi:hypothetical protein